jgi:hypothetical protein
MAKKTTQNPEHKWIVGTWYMNPMGYMINYQRGNHAYGFQGGWKNDLRITPKYLEDNEFIEAPREDILDYLRNEAVERGLIKGSVYESILNNEKITIEGDGEYYLTENNKTLSYLTHVAGYTLLIDGKWAEVVDAPKEYELTFDFGIFGNELENASETIYPLYYTEKIPELGITLELSIWGNTTISYNLGFLHGGKNNTKYGYSLKSVKKEGWDKKSTDWFKSLIAEAHLKLRKTTSVISSGSLVRYGKVLKDGDTLSISADSNLFMDALIRLGNNFLEYKGIDEKIEYTNNTQENKPKIEIGQVYKTGTALYKIDELSTHTIWFYREEDGALLFTSRNDIEHLINIGEWVLQTEEHAFKVGDYFVQKSDISGHSWIITDIEGNVITYKHVVSGDKFYESINWFKNEIATGKYIVITTEDIEGYKDNPQEELKTLLKAYTILADKGNEEAKKEIVILQTLIK